MRYISHGNESAGPETNGVPSSHEQLLAASAEIARTSELWQTPDQTQGWYLCDQAAQIVKGASVRYDALPSYITEPEIGEGGHPVPGAVTEVSVSPTCWDTKLLYPLPAKLLARERVDRFVGVMPDGSVRVEIRSEGKDPSMAIYMEGSLSGALGRISTDDYKGLSVVDTFLPDGTITRQDGTEFASDALATPPTWTATNVDPATVGSDAFAAVAASIEPLRGIAQGMREGTIGYRQPYA